MGCVLPHMQASYLMAEGWGWGWASGRSLRQEQELEQLLRAHPGPDSPPGSESSPSAPPVQLRLRGWDLPCSRLGCKRRGSYTGLCLPGMPGGAEGPAGRLPCTSDVRTGLTEKQGLLLVGVCPRTLGSWPRPGRFWDLLGGGEGHVPSTWCSSPSSSTRVQ